MKDRNEHIRDDNLVLEVGDFRVFYFMSIVKGDCSTKSLPSDRAVMDPFLTRLVSKLWTILAK